MIHQLFPVIIGKGFAALLRGKIRNQPAPDQPIAGIGSQRVVNFRIRMHKGVLPKAKVVIALPQIRDKRIRVWIFVAPLIGAGIGVRVPARLQPDDIAGNIPLPEIIGNAFDLFGIPLIIATVLHPQRPLRNLRAAARKPVVLADDIGDGITLDDIDVYAGGNRDAHAHHQSRVLTDGIELRLAARRAAAGLCRIFSGILLLAAIEFRIAGGIKIHPVALVGDEKRNGRMGFAVGAHRVGIDVQPQLSSSVIKLFQLKTEAEDVAVVLDREFQHAAGRNLFEREVRSGIVYICFNITEAVAKPGGNHFLRHAESKSFHRAVSPSLLPYSGKLLSALFRR